MKHRTCKQLHNRSKLRLKYVRTSVGIVRLAMLGHMEAPRLDKVWLGLTQSSIQNWAVETKYFEPGHGLTWSNNFISLHIRLGLA